MLIADIPLEVTMAALVFSRAAILSAKACTLQARYDMRLQELARAATIWYAQLLELTKMLTV